MVNIRTKMKTFLTREYFHEIQPNVVYSEQQKRHVLLLLVELEVEHLVIQLSPSRVLC